MTKKSILCYQKNGGSCKNRVSLANSFVCGAGHGEGEKALISQKSPSMAAAINLAGMSFRQRVAIARDPSTPAETLSELSEDKNWNVRKAVAANPFASVDNLNTLSKDEVACIREAVAGNPSALPETLAQLAEDKDQGVREAVGWNSSALLETHISLAQQGHAPLGFAKGKSIDELIKEISLVDQYPDTFGLAYLHRLLKRSIPGDKTHPKRRALIGYVYAKYVENRAVDWDIRWYKDKIKVLFPDDQEMAEVVGY